MYKNPWLLMALWNYSSTFLLPVLVLIMLLPRMESPEFGLLFTQPVHPYLHMIKATSKQVMIQKKPLFGLAVQHLCYFKEDSKTNPQIVKIYLV
jgi:hypothetical protein